MSVNFKIPSYVELLPDVFKQRNEKLTTQIKNKNGYDFTLNGYKINPMLLTAYLLDVVNSQFKFFQQFSMEDFRRTRRMNDILFSRDVQMSNPEMYKGFLSFKGTWRDFLYVSRLMGIKVEFQEYHESGLVGQVNTLKKFAQSGKTDYWKFDNSPNQPDFIFYNPTNSFQYNEKSRDAAAQFLFENPTNVTKYGQITSDQFESDFCGFQITIDLNSSQQPVSTVDILTKLSIMLVNRLIPCARVNIIYANFNIDDYWDWINRDKIDEGELGLTFIDDLREDWVEAWKISHITDGETPPILLDGSRKIANRVMTEGVYLQE